MPRPGNAKPNTEPALKAVLNPIIDFKDMTRC